MEISEGLKDFFYFGTAGTILFLMWLIFISPRVKGEGPIRNRAIIIGIVFLGLLILPDIWALTRLTGVNWHIAWAIGLLFIHIFEGGIWHRICWGDKCPKCGAWLDVVEEPVPDNPSMGRKTATCKKCGWSDSWASYTKGKGKPEKADS